ncbi:MAG: ComF family protein [Chloroflexota bacterium]|nr:ComF family protein [Chloroflexota bacterium]
MPPVAPSVAARLWTRLLDLVYPRRCGGCDRLGAWLCADCLAALQPPALPGWICPVCDGPLVAGPGGAGCPLGCDSGGLLGVLAAGAYADPLSAAIKRLKYQNWQVLAVPLAGLLAATCAASPAPWANAVPQLVAVPLHRRRLRERGFNQAALLARALGARLDWPLLDGLVRVRYTTPQARLTADERAVNLEEAFAWRGTAPPPPGPLVLVDDVYTRGFTLNLCAEALRAAGAGAVYGVVVARAGGVPS